MNNNPPIKLRAFYKGEMIMPGQYLGTGSASSTITIELDGKVCIRNLFGLDYAPMEPIDPSEIKISRWTGQQASGQDVYAGDVLAHTVDPTLLEWVVIDYGWGFCIRNIARYERDTLSDPWWVSGRHFFLDRKVIGNIYDNPELVLRPELIHSPEL